MHMEEGDMPVKEAKIDRELYRLIKNVLIKRNMKINGVEFKDIDTQYSIDGGKADLVLLLLDDKPLLVIECKRKIREKQRYRQFRKFDP